MRPFFAISGLHNVSLLQERILVRLDQMLYFALFTRYLHYIGASKAAARRLISDVVKIKDSISIIERMITDSAEGSRSTTIRSSSDKIFDISENLEDMQAAYKSLKARLDRNLRLLTGHDGAAAGLIQDMVNDDMQCLVFKCRAYLMRIHAKVQQAKFAAVPFERRISQSKPGMFASFEQQLYTHICLDIKLRQHTETSLAKRAPSIKQMATKYNSMIQEACKKAQDAEFPIDAIPKHLDVARLYDLDANPHMWMVDAVPTDLVDLPPYLTDNNVQRGISSLLVQDRVKEEIIRLQIERCSMIEWMEVRIKELKNTIARCTGKYSVDITQ